MAFAAICSILGLLAHVWMSHAAVPWWAAVCGFAGTLTMARTVAARERSFVVIAGLMGIAQLGLHLLFDVAQGLAATGAPMSGPATPMAAMPGMSMPMHAAAMAHQGPVMHMAMHMTPGMLGGHAGAALICAWWLRRGEAALHRCARAVAAALARALWLPRVAGAPAPVLARRPVAPRAQPSASACRIRFALVRRGPPRQVPCQ